MLYSYTAVAEGWKDGRFERFKCPVCGDRRYVEVRVQRPGELWYVTPFYECRLHRDVPRSGQLLRMRFHAPSTDQMLPEGAYRVEGTKSDENDG